jgi:hypothetical protein
MYTNFTICFSCSFTTKKTVYSQKYVTFKKIQLNISWLLFTNYAGYYYTGTDTYDIKWSMPHCVLTLRLIGLTVDVYDGTKPTVRVTFLFLVYTSFYNVTLFYRRNYLVTRRKLPLHGHQIFWK